MSEAKTAGEMWIDIGSFGWLVRYEHDDTWIDFKAYECIGENVSPDPGRKSFRKDTPRGDETVYIEDLDKAEVTIEGFVKWDGCSEMTLCRPHFCGVDNVQQFAQAMTKLHELCLLLPRVDRECAGYPASGPPKRSDDG